MRPTPTTTPKRPAHSVVPAVRVGESSQMNLTRDGGRILLIKRRDHELWPTLSAGTNIGDTVEQTVHTREVKEKRPTNVRDRGTSAVSTTHRSCPCCSLSPPGEKSASNFRFALARGKTGTLTIDTRAPTSPGRIPDYCATLNIPIDEAAIATT